MKKERWIDIGILLLLLLLPMVFAVDPEGATVTFLFNSTKDPASPTARNDSKGTIHTIKLSAENQNSKWKAYVGNVSSTFVLDDADGYSIYQWQLGTSYQYSGQVYVTRDSSATWSGIACASKFNKTTEDTRLGHNSIREDSVNRTFSYLKHKTFSVAGQSIGNGTCYSTATWVDDTVQTVNQSAYFQEVLLWEGSEVVYTTFVENNQQGYRDAATGDTYDFQILLPDNATTGSRPVRYYFYLELS